MTIAAMDTEEEVIEREEGQSAKKWEMMRNRKSIPKRRRKQGSAAESKGSASSAASLELGRGEKDDDILTDDEGWLTAASMTVKRKNIIRGNGLLFLPIFTHR